MSGRQCDTIRRAGFQKEELVKIQDMAANLTRNITSSLQEMGAAFYYKENSSFNKHYWILFIDLWRCMSEVHFMSLQTARPNPTVWTMTVHGMLRCMLQEKRENVIILLEKDYISAFQVWKKGIVIQNLSNVLHL